MLRLFGSVGRERPVAERVIPPETVVWAVGDVHGRFDLLSPLLQAILQDLALRPTYRRVLIMLGDNVDRGPQSREVLDLLADQDARPAVEAHFLRGNHDDRMEAVLDDPSQAPSWCDYGGRETFRSYGVSVPTRRSDHEGWRAAVAELNAVLPEAHRSFLKAQELSISIGDFFFCHAGARPGVPLADQKPHDLMWIRHEFLQDKRLFEQIVVHGHTPTEAVYSDRRRIGLDTAAYATGVLTALRLEGTDRRLLQTDATDGLVSLRRSQA